VPAESTEKVFQEVSASFIKLNNLLKLLIFYLMSFQPGRDPIEERGRLSLEARHRDTSLRSITIEAFEARKAELKGDGKSQRAPWQKPPPWQALPAFYSSLQDLTVTHLALRLLILTGARSSPLRMMRTEHVDGDTWTIPGELMRGRKGATSDCPGS
jgi:integrase